MKTQIEKVFKFKKELIKRDPLFIELDNVFKRAMDIGLFKPQMANTDEDHDFMTPGRMWLPNEAKEKRNREQSLLFLRLIELGHQTQDKWNIFIRFNFSYKRIFIVAPHTEERVYVGIPSSFKLKSGKLCFKNIVGRDAKPLYRWLPVPNSFNEASILTSIENFMFQLERGTEGQKWIPIIVNASRLNKADAKAIKKQVWSAIEPHLQKGLTKKPWREAKECSFLYSMRREETFQNYLRWYDLYIGNDYKKPDGFSFRAIALCESIFKKHPDEYENAKEMVANSTKVVRSAKGKRTLKGYVGQPVKGEDKVEKGIKLIYEAIHRERYPSKKTKQKEYNCPTHGVSCPVDCSYQNDFMRDFNRRNMLFKTLYTLSPDVLEQVVDDEINPKGRKQKKPDVLEQVVDDEIYRNGRNRRN